MSEDATIRMMREAAIEWGWSAAQTTLSSIDNACPAAGVQPYLLDLDRVVADRAASLLEEGLDEALADVWESTARETISACLAVHDAQG